MTRSLVTVSTEDEVQEAIRRMEKDKVRRILVVNDQGSVAGILVQAQIARNLDKSSSGEMLQDISQTNKR